MGEENRSGTEQTNRDDNTSCLKCGRSETAAYPLLLDGEQRVTIRLCDPCYESCYNEIRSASWIETPAESDDIAD